MVVLIARAVGADAAAIQKANKNKSGRRSVCRFLLFYLQKVPKYDIMKKENERRYILWQISIRLKIKLKVKPKVR